MPYVRFEAIDTQKDLPSESRKVEGTDSSRWTFGVNYKPIPEITWKADYVVSNSDNDQFNFLLGWIF